MPTQRHQWVKVRCAWPTKRNGSNNVRRDKVWMPRANEFCDGSTRHKRPSRVLHSGCHCCRARDSAQDSRLYSDSVSQFIRLMRTEKKGGRCCVERRATFGGQATSSMPEARHQTSRYPIASTGRSKSSSLALLCWCMLVLSRACIKVVKSDDFVVNTVALLRTIETLSE
jgi:hypothetical protein